MTKHMRKVVGLLSVVVMMAFFAPQQAAADDDDPPSRVARLGYLHGPVSFEPAGTDDWVDAVVNRPMTTGDKLWLDGGARGELHIGSASIRLSGNTGFSFLNLTDQMTQLRLTQGTLRVRVKRLDENENLRSRHAESGLFRPPSWSLSNQRQRRRRYDGGEDPCGEGEVTAAALLIQSMPERAAPSQERTNSLLIWTVTETMTILIRGAQIVTAARTVPLRRVMFPPM